MQWKQVLLIPAMIMSTALSSEAKSKHHKHPVKRDIPTVVQETLPSIVSLIIRSGKYANNDVDSILESDNLGHFIEPDYRSPRMEDLSMKLCSGIFITPNGIIVTNFHCINDTSLNIKAVTADGKVYPAHIIGAESKLDLALVKIDDTLASFRPIKIGSSELLRKGEDVLTIGNPLGFSHCVTRGIVSNKNIKLGMHPYEDFIQTDAPINPGNSGGALINDRGELIGINDAIIPESQSIGFAIPSRILVRLLDEVSENGKMRYSWFGMKTRKVRQSEMRWMCLDGQPRVLVEDLVPKSPVSDKLRNGDVIIKMGDDEIHDMNDIRNSALYQPPYKLLKIIFMRDCQLMGVNVIPIERPKGKVKLGPEPKSENILK